ncbi:MAG: hypothetical protein A4S09_17615 [Proteobacteria bacterium SG_bin7]|nr:MAG: hypothetical protein A4S09_17615 [Proteobacteria bacterium SG_bin7]
MHSEKTHSVRELLSTLKQKPFLLAFLMGFSSGMPFLLTSKTMQVWLKEANVDLTVIGIFSMVALPYTLKFLWAPLIDRYQFPFLGLRRGWLFVCQVFLGILIGTMALINPAEHLWGFAVMALLVSFFGATQDVVVDAYRIETLSRKDLGPATALYMYGYKTSMLITGALALVLADHISWRSVYIIMALVMALTVSITFFADEPKVRASHPESLQQAVVNPFKEFLTRKYAVWILLFVVLYKVGDNMAANMLSPFYLDMGYSKTEIGIIAKLISPTMSWVGPVLGGFLVYSLGISGALWFAGVLQAASTFCFAILAWVPKNLWIYGAIISFEDVTAMIGNVAFVSFMSSSVNRQFTATQFALLSGLAQIPRVIIAAPAGYFAKTLGWPPFFIFCALAAVPGLFLIFFFLRPRPQK